MTEHPHLTTRQLVAQVAEALGETEPTPLHQIRCLITVMGAAFAQELLRTQQARRAVAARSILVRCSVPLDPDMPS